MNVGIRVDASPRIGTGHLRRCLSLAQALRSEGTNIRFVTRDLGVDSLGMIEEQGFSDIALLCAPRVHGVDDPAIPHAAWSQVSQKRDINETIHALMAHDCEWVVVDSYSFDSRWHDAVRIALACRIAQIDDVADRTIAPDLLIDHNHAGNHAAKYAGHMADHSRILGGPDYALLGPRFADAERYAFDPEVRSVGLFMGGIDVGNFSATVLRALDDINFSGPVEVVTTRANPNLPPLRAIVAQRPKTHLSLDLPDLAAFFARHDLQIGAGGGASWERCCIGVPTLLVVVAENQDAVAPELAHEGVAVLAKSPDCATIAAALAELIESPDKRRDMAARSRALVDGRGAARVAKEIRCFA